MTDTVQQIRAELFAMRNEQYAKFQQKLMPTVSPDSVIGVRTPQLRKYAKQIAGSPRAQSFLTALPHAYYDENNLHGALIEYIRDIDTAFAAVENLLPYINNWATCDMFCPKVLLKQPDRLWDAILRWLESDKVYTIRYGLVRLTTWYLDAPRFTPSVLEVAAKVTHEDYYIRMAQAWLFSIALVKQYDTTLPYLIQERLPAWIHNKAIQKAVESYRIPPEAKTYLKMLKRTH